MSRAKTRAAARVRRHRRVRKKLVGTTQRPRLAVFRSNKYIYAQVIDDATGSTLLTIDSKRAASVEAPKGVAGKCAIAYGVGRAVADLAKEKGIAAMVFDRNGYLYHGRVAALARGLRDGGIEV